MSVCSYPTVSQLKSIDPKTFFQENLPKIVEDRFKYFYASLDTTASFICLLKSQRFACSVPFNVIEMV